jgi:hypothetical protein
LEEKKNAEEETGQTSLLSLLQQKFDATSELRTDSGLFKKFRPAETTERNIIPPDLDSDMEDYDEDEVLTSDTARPKLPQQSSTKKQMYSSPSDVDAKTPSSKWSSAKQQRRDSTGNSFIDGIQTGNFYSSGGTRKDSERKDSDARTFRTFQKKDAKSSRPGQTTGSTDETIAKADERMKISIVFSIKLIDLIVVQEDYLFDIAPEQLKRPGNSGRVSVGALSQDYYSGDEESSSDDVSDLSVLTDDQRFFSETGQVGPIAEEEDDDGNGAKMSSTDFLLFGLPEDPLLRLTVESLSASLRGRSGGRLNFGGSIRRISALGENNCHIFSMGTYDVATPVSEVDFSAARRRSFDSFDMDLSTSFLCRQGSGVSSRGRGSDSGRAISLILSIDENYKDILCEFSKILLTLDLMPASKLVQFYARSEIKFPDRIVEKSSRDVARKFMVYKTTAQSSLKAINATVRVHGLEIRVPLSVDSSESSEASHVDASNSYDDDSLRTPLDSRPKAAWIISTDSLELYSGSPVDEFTAAATNDFGASRSSLFSGSVANRRAAPVKALEMLDIVELTSSSDSFSCRHVVSTNDCDQDGSFVEFLLMLTIDRLPR